MSLQNFTIFAISLLKSSFQIDICNCYFFVFQSNMDLLLIILLLLFDDFVNKHIIIFIMSIIECQCAQSLNLIKQSTSS